MKNRNILLSIFCCLLVFALKANDTTSSNHPPENRLESLTFCADLEEGNIGVSAEQIVDDAKDNIFQFQLDDIALEQYQIFLEYEVNGIANQAGIAKSINHHQATGGYLVSKSSHWSKMKEQLDPSLLKAGTNFVQYNALRTAYKLRNVKLVLVPRIEEAPITITNATWDAVNQRAYIRGFVKETGNLCLNEEALELSDNQFEYLWQIAPDSIRQNPLIRFSTDEGKLITQSLTFEENVLSQEIFAFAEKTASLEQHLQVASKYQIEHEGASLDLPLGAIQEEMELSITPLRGMDTPPLTADMVNVTKQYAAYRFQPDGTMFKRHIDLQLEYDPALIPEGYSAADVQTFYFDTKSKEWIVVHKDTILFDRNRIVSKTNHFTDYINGIIKTPDASQTAAFEPTSITGFQAADPSASIVEAIFPQANNRGSASTSIPLKLPPMRNMQPNLALQYNNAGGHSELGTGWSLPNSSITIDTRWGVPRYDRMLETETYLLDGDQLDGVTHRKNWESRFTNPTRRYHRRQEGAFQKIIRHGTSPDTYWWEVTSKGGIISYYGGTPSTGVDKNAVLTDDRGSIAQWNLLKVIDTNGNFMEYHYRIYRDTGLDNGNVEGRQIYLSSINYTGHGDDKGAYSVELVRTSDLGETKRVDVKIDCSLGFKRVSSELLREIKVYYGNSLIRSYEMEYRQGQFYKTLLATVTERDEVGEVFYEHRFDYYDDTNGGENLFEEDVLYTIPDDKVKGKFIFPNVGEFEDKVSLLGGSESNNFGGGGSVCVGLPFGTGKKMTVGGNLYFSTANSFGLLAYVDINGDGLPDKVFIDKSNGSLVYRPSLYSHSNKTYEFGAKKTIKGIDEFSRSKTKTNAKGLEANVAIPLPEIFIGKTWAKSRTTISTYMSDVNGDRLMDIIKNNRVYFAYIDDDGCVNYSTNSIHTANPIISAAAAIMPEISDSEREEFEQDNPLYDVVRMWQAPYSGKIIIDAPVTLSNTQASAEYAQKDGVKVSVQHDANVRATATLTATNSIGFDRPISINIRQGDRIYFRVHSIYDGAYDQVAWNPTIMYEDIPTTEIDANNKKTHRFNAKEDFLITTPQSVVMPLKGLIQIEGVFKKPNTTSDDLRVLILRKRNELIEPVYNKYFAWSDKIDSLPIEFQLEVDSLDQLEFYVNTSTNIDWTSISWNPFMFYDEVENRPDIMTRDNEGKPILSFCPGVEYSMLNSAFYSANSALGRTGQWVVRDSGVLRIKPDLSFIAAYNLAEARELSGNIVLSVKQVNKLRGKVEKSLQSIGHSREIELSVQAGDTLFIEYHIKNRILASRVRNIKVKIDGIPRSVPIHTSIFQQIFGPLYRGWGQFIYRADTDARVAAINNNQLRIDVPDDLDIPDNIDDLDGTVNPSQEVFIAMYPDAKTGVWRGSDNLTYITADSMSSSRMGQDNIENFSVPNSMGNNQMYLPSKFSYSSQTGTSGGAGVSVVSGTLSKSKNTSVSIIEVMDMNNDGRSDIVTIGGIQYSKPIGGLESDITYHSVGGHTSKAEANGIAIGGVVVVSRSDGSSGDGSPNGNKSAGKKIDNNAKDSKEAAGNAKGSINVGGNYNENIDRTEATWYDINGDGLSDKIYEDGYVQLNIGYGFLPKEQWNFLGIRKGKSIDVGAGGGFGYSTFFGGFSGGFSLSASYSHMLYAFQDINGDGLPDKIYKPEVDEFFFVSLNTGNGFSELIRWKGLDVISKNKSIGESANFAFTLRIPLGIASLVINPKVSAGQGVSRPEAELRDINGDGDVDILTSKNDGELKVRHSNIRRTNMLKTVHRPLGASFTIDYKLEGNTYEHPNSVWVMSDVTVEDGFAGDGVDVMKTVYDYEGGYHSRREREFYGFAKVIATDLDTANDDQPYRKQVMTYDNSGYYTKGALLSAVELDAAGNKYKETINSYELRDLSGAKLPEEFNKTNDSGVAYNALVETNTYNYEGQDEPYLAHKMSFEYDSLGNVIQYADYGDGTAADKVEARIQYHDKEESYIKAMPASIEILTEEGSMRKREQDIDEAGNVLEIRHYLAEDSVAVTNMEYNGYGNLEKITYPENYRGQRMFYEYTYDDDIQTYITSVTDAFGYRSESKYEYKYGNLLETTDLNGHKMRYEIDQRGRITKVISPKELAAGKDYTIKIEYYENAAVPYGLVRHYDPEHEQDIQTATFLDGLSRPVQVKKTAAIYNEATERDELKYVVSGWTKFDGLGRASESYHPMVENVGNIGTINRNYDSVEPTRMEYDTRDRALATILPDGARSRVSYSIANDNTGYLAYKTSLIDAEGNRKDAYADVKGRNRATTDYGDDGKIWTHFRYNAISERIKVIDDAGNESISTYDKLGRRTRYQHPDAGLIETFYDLTGNMTAQITPNIRETLTDPSPERGAIKYQYDYGRLMQIDYPINYQNQVRYHYGAPDDVKHNRAGRVYLIEDASGAQEFFFGNMGEVQKTIRTIVVSEDNIMTFVSEEEYDAWNRIQSRTYPDGEKVDFQYNAAGKLNAMSSEKAGFAYSILDQIGYDKFEQRVFMRHGNGTETTYNYEADRRRLAQMGATTKGGQIFMDNTYQYDLVSNILSIENDAPTLAGQLGGTLSCQYEYNKLYELTGATGVFRGDGVEDRYSMSMSYDKLHNITHKQQEHSQSGLKVLETTYEQTYEYKGARPHTPTKIGNKKYEYDANGNFIAWTGERPEQGSRNALWDEVNHLKAVIDDAYLSKYTYDVGGERVIKSHGGLQGVFMNGESVGFVNHTENYTLYVSPFCVYREGGAFTKHYFAEGTRIASRIGTGIFFQSAVGQQGLTAGNLDLQQRVRLLEAAARDIYQTYGTPPGHPTREYDRDMPYNGEPIDVSNTEDYTRAAQGFPQRPIVVDTTRPPGHPTRGGTLVTNDDVKSGYGFLNNTNEPERNHYFFHGDHLGSTSYVSDISGNLRQFVGYMPFGETFVEQFAMMNDEQPYLFNGKERDRVTGLYYYGARYYDPKASIWMSVDPLEEIYPSTSPYSYVANNPIIFVDPDGRYIKGVTIDKNGNVQLSKKASKATRRIYSAMSKTKTGSAQFKKMVGSDTKIKFSIVNWRLEDNDHGTTEGSGRTKNGSYKRAKITISTAKAGDRFDSATTEELINSVGAHESVHAVDPKQIAEDASKDGSHWETERAPIEMEYKSRTEYNKGDNTKFKDAYEKPNPAKDDYGNTKPSFRLRKD